MPPTQHERTDLARLVARQPAGHTLLQPFHTDASTLAVDLEAVWMRHWLYAGHAGQIPGPGDYFLYEIGGESVIVLRGDDGEVRAFANVCRHRGSVLCSEPCGTVKRLVCPYHQWVYDKSGVLLAAKHLPMEFDRSQYGLSPVACRMLPGGFLFICFRPLDDLPPFDDFAAQVAPHLQIYAGLEKASIGARATYTVRSNWKLIVENFRECYHCGGTHPEYCRVITGANYASDWNRVGAYKSEKREEWTAKEVPTEMVDFLPGAYRYCERYPYEPGKTTMSLDGSPIAPVWNVDLNDRGDVGAFSLIQYPNCWIDINRDYAFTMRITPKSADECEISLLWLVRQGAQAGVDFDLEKLTAFWKTTGEQDWKLCEDTQKGVASRYYQPFPYAHVEAGPAQFCEWYLDELRRFLAA